MQILRFYHIKPIWLTAFILWGLFILIMSVIPDSGEAIREGSSKYRWDYLLHFLAYFAFGALYIIWRGDMNYSIRGAELFILFVVTCSFAILTEYLQLLVPGRTFNPVDMAYNLAGVISSILLVYFFLLRYFFRKKHPSFKT